MKNKTQPEKNLSPSAQRNDAGHVQAGRGTLQGNPTCTARHTPEYVRLTQRGVHSTSPAITLDLIGAVCTRSVTREIVKDRLGRLVEYCEAFWFDRHGKKRTSRTKRVLA